MQFVSKRTIGVVAVVALVALAGCNGLTGTQSPSSASPDGDTPQPTPEYRSAYTDGNMTFIHNRHNESMKDQPFTRSLAFELKQNGSVSQEYTADFAVNGNESIAKIAFGSGDSVFNQTIYRYSNGTVVQKTGNQVTQREDFDFRNTSLVAPTFKMMENADESHEMYTENGTVYHRYTVDSVDQLEANFSSELDLPDKNNITSINIEMVVVEDGSVESLNVSITSEGGFGQMSDGEGTAEFTVSETISVGDVAVEQPDWAADGNETAS